jgi:hypothetical protein
VILTGPSGVGKGPIVDWTRRLFVPGLCQVRVRKTKTERHTGSEDDLGFDGEGGEFYRFQCRGYEQRIYLDELDSSLEKKGVVLLEAYFKAFDFLMGRYNASVDVVSTFISPLCSEEVQELDKESCGLDTYLPDLMLDSLVRRAGSEGKVLSHKLLWELEQRAVDAINEMRFAKNYGHVIPNHCYESDARWKFPVLIGEPRRVVTSLADIIDKGHSDYASSGQEFFRFPI